MKYIVGIFLIVMSLHTQQVLACSCAGWEDAQEMLKSADAVIIAVPSEDSVIDNSIPSPYVNILKTGMKIVKSYKGKYKKFFYLFTEEDLGGNCGANFKQKDAVYLIFAYRKNKRYYSDSCSLSPIDPRLQEVTNILSQLPN